MVACQDRKYACSPKAINGLPKIYNEHEITEKEGSNVALT